MKVKTDNKFRPFKYREEVPLRVLQREFDYLDEEDVSDGFFKHRGVWYHLSMFETTRGMKDLAAWDGYHGDSYFSGTLIKLSRDGESYKIGTYFE